MASPIFSCLLELRRPPVSEWKSEPFHWSGESREVWGKVAERKDRPRDDRQICLPSSFSHFTVDKEHFMTGTGLAFYHALSVLVP